MSADPVEICSRIRDLTAIPLVIVTTGDVAQRTAALTLGADLCVSARDDVELIAAQIAALLRRQSFGKTSAEPRLQLGGLVLDSAARTVNVGGESLALSPREFDLLEFLGQGQGRAFRRHELLDAVWGRSFFGEPGTIDVHISWLRQKLPAAAGIRITTVRGIGYRLDVI
jgi:DNA-binding response OmpR family regulator